MDVRNSLFNQQWIAVLDEYVEKNSNQTCEFFIGINDETQTPFLSDNQLIRKLSIAEIVQLSEKCFASCTEPSDLKILNRALKYISNNSDTNPTKVYQLIKNISQTKNELKKEKIFGKYSKVKFPSTSQLAAQLLCTLREYIKTPSHIQSSYIGFYEMSEGIFFGKYPDKNIIWEKLQIDNIFNQLYNYYFIYEKNKDNLKELISILNFLKNSPHIMDTNFTIINILLTNATNDSPPEKPKDTTSIPITAAAYRKKLQELMGIAVEPMTFSQIKSCYFKWLRINHPDKNTNPYSTAITQEILDTFNLLREKCNSNDLLPF